MLDAQWLKAFVPIGHLKSSHEWLPAGAGVLYLHKSLIWIITAKHVVEGGNNTALLVSQKNKNTAVIDLQEIHKQNKLRWLYHNRCGLSASLMPVSNDFDIKAIGKENCIRADEVIPSMQCYTVGCPHGVRGFNPETTTPLLLSGIISGVNPKDKTIYTSTPTFPGNSGGPLIVFRSPITTGGNMTVGLPTVLLAGIITSFILVPESATWNGVPPLHLGVAISIEEIEHLLNSDEALELVKQVTVKQ